MCLSAPVSLVAAAALVPTGAFTIYRAFSVDRRFLALATLPVLFGLQQYFEGMVWLAGADKDAGAITTHSMVYMFFAWIAWPVWVPISGYFIETGRKRLLYLAFAVGGAMLGALLFVPYFAHDGWLTVQFLDLAIVYETTELLDFIVAREFTYGIYVFFVITPLLISSDRNVRFFGMLIAGVLAVTYGFFQYAHISVFCFGGALASLYLVFTISQKSEAVRSSA